MRGADYSGNRSLFEQNLTIAPFGTALVQESRKMITSGAFLCLKNAHDFGEASGMRLWRTYWYWHPFCFHQSQLPQRRTLAGNERLFGSPGWFPITGEDHVEDDSTD